MNPLREVYTRRKRGGKQKKGKQEGEYMYVCSRMFVWVEKRERGRRGRKCILW